MLQPASASTLMLGIHEADEAKYILTLSNNKSLLSTKEVEIEPKTLLVGMSRIQSIVETLTNKQKQILHQNPVSFWTLGDEFFSVLPMLKENWPDMHNNDAEKKSISNQKSPEPSFKRDYNCLEWRKVQEH